MGSPTWACSKSSRPVMRLPSNMNWNESYVMNLAAVSRSGGTLSRSHRRRNTAIGSAGRLSINGS